MPGRAARAYTRIDSAAFSAADPDPVPGSVGGRAIPEISKLLVTIGADTRDAEAGFARVSSSIGGFATGAAAALTAAGVGIVGAGAAAVKSAADFEATMSGVKAVSGATATEMKGLSGLALQLGKDTAFSASEAAAGIEELVKGGLTIPDVMNGAAKATLALAAAGGVSLPDAANIAANALAQFHLKGADMAHVADLIAGAADSAAIGVGDFKFSLQSVGAVAAQAGFSIDDTTLAITALGKAGIVGSDAGTSLKAMFLNLQPSTKAAKAAMQDLGLWTAKTGSAFFDANGNVKSAVEVGRLLENATKNLTRAQKLQAFETIFGSDAIRAATVFADEGAAGLGRLAGSINKVSADAKGLERLNNLAGDVKTLGGSVETLAITFGTALLPALRDATQWATSFVNGLIPWAERIGPQVVTVVQGLGAAVSALIRSGDVGAFVGALGAVAGLDLGPFVTAIRAVETAIGNIAAGFREGGLGGAFTAWLTEAGKFGQTLVTWIGDQVNPIATKLGEWGAAFVGWIAPRLPGLVVALGSLATTVWTWITDTALPTIKEKLLSWGGAFLTWVTPLVTSLPGALLGVATAVTTWIGENYQPILDKLGSWKDAFVAWATPIAQAIPGALADVATGVWTWIKEAYQPILDRLGTWKDAFLAWVTPLVKALPGKLGELKDAAFAWIGDNYQPLLTKLGAWKDAFLEWVVPLITALPTKLGELKDAALTWIGENYQPIVDKLGSWKDAFLAWVTPLVLALPDQLVKVKDAIVTWATKTAVPAIVTAWEELKPKVVPVIVGAFETARDDLKPVWAEITKQMTDFEPTGKRLERLFNTIGTTVTEMLVPAIKKLWPKGDGQGPSFFQVLAMEVNAFSEKWEKAIDDFADSARKINDFYQKTKPFWDVLDRLSPGGAGAGLAPAITDIIGAAARSGGGGGGGTGGGGGSTTAGAPSPRAGETVVGGPDPANGKYAYQSRDASGNVHVEWRDRGGPGYAGRAYGIGVPEVFVPNTPGRFVPLGGAGFGGPSTANVTLMLDRQVLARVNARLDERRAKRGDR